MTKTAKPKPSKKKKPIKAEPKKTNNAISIDCNNDEVVLDIKDGGEYLGTINSTIVHLHKVMQTCQAIWNQVEENHDNPSGYTKIYADHLSTEFGFNVPDEAAYRIANHVAVLFATEKKSSED